jgi:hypothetical protein
MVVSSAARTGAVVASQGLVAATQSHPGRSSASSSRGLAPAPTSPQHAEDPAGGSRAGSFGAETGGDGFRWWAKTLIRDCYHNPRVQYIIAVLITSYFVVQCVQAQIDPHKDTYVVEWVAIEDTFNIIFSLELFANAYGNWMWPFLNSGWNIFDIVVVVLGLMDLFRFKFDGDLALLNAPVRMLRVFRVFRLFGRVQSLRLIIVALRKALPGVFNAFFIILVTMCIYAVIAVEVFTEVHEDCWNAPYKHGAITWRGGCFGPEYFGTFVRSLYTLFQVLTGESWSEAVVRPVLHYWETDVSAVLGVSFFFISYNIIMAGVLQNVVVAVLLDGMAGMENTGASKEAAAVSNPAADADSNPAADADSNPPADADGEPEDLQVQLEAARAELAELREAIRAANSAFKCQLEAIVAEPPIQRVIDVDSIPEDGSAERKPPSRTCCV